MKSCRATIISLANFSGSEDRNNPGCRRSTGMNRASLHTRRIGRTDKGVRDAGKGVRDRLWPDIKCKTNCIGTRRNMRSVFFISLSSFFSFFSSFFFSSCCVATPQRCSWFAAHINKIVATFSRTSRVGLQQAGMRKTRGRRITVIEHKSSLRRTHR